MLVRRKGRIHAEIWRYASAKLRRLGPSVAVGVTGSRRVRFEVVGDQLTLLVNGVERVSVRDSAISGPGQAGLRARYEGYLADFLVKKFEPI